MPACFNPLTVCGPALGVDIAGKQSCYPATGSQVFPVLQKHRQGNRRRLWPPPMETSLVLFVPPLPLCTRDTSAKYVCFPEPSETVVHLATSSLEVAWGQLQGMELPLATLHSPPVLLSDLWLPPWSSQDCGKCSVSQHQKTIALYFVEGFPTVTWHGRVGKQLRNSSLIFQVSRLKLNIKITYNNTVLEGTEKKITETTLLSIIECPQADSLLGQATVPSIT